MHIVEALGDPCCNCGSRQIVKEPIHLIGACAQCSPAALAELRWNQRVARAAGHVPQRPVVQQPPAPAFSGNWAATRPARKQFGRLPRRREQSAPMPAARKLPVQLILPGF